MTTVEIKENLINKINRTEDKSLLTEISRLIDLEEEVSEVYYLSERQQQVVNESRAEYQRGEILSSNEANSEIKKWLEE